jgi:hypothetical protein
MLILLEVEECISSDTFYKFMMFLHKIRGCRERDRMVVGFTTTCAISAYYHLGCVYVVVVCFIGGGNWTTWIK